MRSYYKADAKRVYYLSLEFLIGHSLTNALLSLGIYDSCRLAMQELDIDLEAICDLEFDAALGNGDLRYAIDMIRDGYFSPEQCNRYTDISDTLTHWGDNYWLLADYQSSIECNQQVDAIYINRAE